LSLLPAAERGRKGDFIMKSFLRAGLALPVLYLFSVCALILPSSAGANPACGDTLTSGVTTMDAALVCTDTGDGTAALTLTGSATLDMNGFYIVCGDHADDLTAVLMDGVFLNGTKNTLANGAIRNCQDGVELGGGGGHTVSMVHATEGWDDGFDVKSDGNKLSQVTSWGNDDAGVVLVGNKNQVTNSVARSNDIDGFDIEGDGNKLKFVTSYGNLDDGFWIDGNKNSLSNISAADNGDEGIDISNTADGNKIKSAHTVSSGDNGIELEGNKNKLSGVVILGPPDDGVDLWGTATGNKLSKVFVAEPSGEGIELDTAGNSVQKSTSVMSPSTDAYDEASDIAGSCVNSWKGNHFANGWPAECVGSVLNTPPLP